MAGFVYFTKKRYWSSSSFGFIDMMERAIAKCCDWESSLVEAFQFGVDVRSLWLENYDHNMQLALTERILDAARECLQELRADSGGDPVDVEYIERLVTLAEAHLLDLQSGDVEGDGGNRPQ